MIAKTSILIILLSINIFASEYAVVVDKSVQINKLTQKQIRDIFMMKRHFVKDIKIVPVNISSSAKLRDEFEKKVLKINRVKLNRYWIKQHFQGISPPIIQSSDNSMRLFIQNVKGAIGYLPISAVNQELRILYEF
ncbi:MAG: hypothetical protein COB17_00670 [Sulfurimonas sp.]|nr:MAG: hypothetical protein COB17_00670 [Sulfurimonas sp.]